MELKKNEFEVWDHSYFSKLTALLGEYCMRIPISAGRTIDYSQENCKKRDNQEFSEEISLCSIGVYAVFKSKAGKKTCFNPSCLTSWKILHR